MVTDEQLELMRRQLEAYDALPAYLRRRIADDANPIDPVPIRKASPGDRLWLVERASAYMRELVAEITRQALAK